MCKLNVCFPTGKLLRTSASGRLRASYEVALSTRKRHCTRSVAVIQNARSGHSKDLASTPERKISEKRLVVTVMSTQWTTTFRKRYLGLVFATTSAALSYRIDWDVGKPSSAAYGEFSFVTDAGQTLQDKFLHTDS